MSQGRTADIEIVRRCFRAFRERDVEALLAMVAADIEVTSLMTQAERTAYHGHEGVREWLAAVFEIFPDWTPIPAELRDLGGAVVVAMDVTATAVRSGVRIDQRFWCAATLRDDELNWYGFFRTEAEALAALEERAAA